jgi:MerR family transcriptional regulator/heat shock protein HspR
MSGAPTPGGSGGFSPPGPEAKVFVISVAAELSGLHPQTLRTYDRLGLVAPGRTGGGGRRYSLRDIELLRTVARLTAEGLGLEGVRRVIELENQVAALQERVAELQVELAQSRQVQNLPALIADNQVMIWSKRRR